MTMFLSPVLLSLLGQTVPGKGTGTVPYPIETVSECYPRCLCRASPHYLRADFGNSNTQLFATSMCVKCDVLSKTDKTTHDRCTAQKFSTAMSSFTFQKFSTRRPGGRMDHQNCLRLRIVFHYQYRAVHDHSSECKRPVIHASLTLNAAFTIINSITNTILK